MPSGEKRARRFAITLGDPAGIGPEIALRALEEPLGSIESERPEIVLVGERSAIDAVRGLAPATVLERIAEASAGEVGRGAPLALLDPVGERRTIELGASKAADARAALAS